MKGKLFLAGGGNEKQSFDVDREFAKIVKKVLYIPIAWNNIKKNETYESHLDWFTKCMNQHSKMEISMLIDLNTPINLKEFDAVYIGGGNTFKLLHKMRESKFDKKLVDFFNSGGIIFGGSAGAILFGNDINIGLICKDRDSNKIGLKNTHGHECF